MRVAVPHPLRATIRLARRAAFFVLLAPISLQAQFTNETAIERDGVRFFVRPSADIEHAGNGVIRVTLTDIDYRVDRAYGVVVDGQRSSFDDFGGELESAASSLAVTALDVGFTFTGVQGCSRIGAAVWRVGVTNTLSCNSNADPRFTDYQLSGIATSGVFDLHRAVRRLRTAQRQAAQAASTEPSSGNRPQTGSSASGSRPQSGSGSARPSSSGSSGEGSSAGSGSGDRPGGARPMDGPASSTPRPSPPPRNPGQDAVEKLGRDIQESTRRRDSLANALTNQLASIAAQRAADEEAAEEERERRRREAEAAEERRVANVEQSRRRFIAMLERDRSAAVASIQAVTTARQRVLTDVERAKTYRERPTERWAFIVATRRWAEPRWPASVDESAFSYNDDSGHESAYRSRADSYANAANGIATETIVVSRPFLVRPDAEGFYPLTAPMIAKFQRQNAGFTNVEVLGWYTREQADALYARTAERVQQCRCRVTLTRTVFVP